MARHEMRIVSTLSLRVLTAVALMAVLTLAQSDGSKAEAARWSSTKAAKSVSNAQSVSISTQGIALESVKIEMTRS